MVEDPPPQGFPKVSKTGGLGLNDELKRASNRDEPMRASLLRGHLGLQRGRYVYRRVDVGATWSQTSAPQGLWQAVWGNPAGTVWFAAVDERTKWS